MIKILKILFKIKLRINNLKKKKIVILDPVNSFYLHKVLSKYDHTFLTTRHEEVNIYIFIITLFNCRLNQELTFYQKYLINYINILNPKIIISCTSHDVLFLSLKKFFPNKIIIAIQHASLSALTLNNILTNKKDSKKFNIDYVCVFGTHGKFFYSKFINAKKFLITGSIKNNLFKKNKNINNTIAYLSQFRLNTDKKMRVINTKKYEKFFFENLKKYCRNKKYKLSVISSNIKNLKKEKFYYDKIIGKENYQFLYKKEWSSSYKYSLKYDYFITHSSTLGYELMARNKRVVFAHEYEDRIKSKDFIQAFYSKNYNGNFWTNTKNPKKFKDTLDHTFYCSKTEFEKNKLFFISPLVVYKKDNYVFNNLITEIY